MNSLRVMSFNLRYGTANDGKNRWDLRKEAVVAVVQKLDFTAIFYRVRRVEFLHGDTFSKRRGCISLWGRVSEFASFTNSILETSILSVRLTTARVL